MKHRRQRRDEDLHKLLETNRYGDRHTEEKIIIIIVKKR